MEHIRQYDWCTSTPDNIHFLTAEAIDRSVTEKILRNKFTNPLISSDEEEESGPGGHAHFWDWDLIFRRKNTEGCYRTFVPGLRPAAPSPRLSALTAAQHSAGLRVLCAARPALLPDVFLPRPGKLDHRVFEEIKEAYLKEQKEFMEWARQLWVSKHCFRALRPKPLVESVYEAEFKMRAQRLKHYPKVFEVAAQISLSTAENCEIVLQEDLIDVNISELPQVKYPEKMDKRWTVLRPCSLPVPCEKHPVQMVLPGEKEVSILPLSEVHGELAMFAAARGVQLVAAERALCTLAARRAWALPATVHAAPAADGYTNNIIVLGSEFSNQREDVILRTFKAYQHLLEFAVVPTAEREKKFNQGAAVSKAASSDDVTAPAFCSEPSSDDEDHLFIDFDEMSQTDQSQSQETEDTNHTETDSDVDMRIEETTGELGEKETEELEKKETEKLVEKEKEDVMENKEVNISVSEGFGVYSCTCKDTVFERPPPRSFRRYQLRRAAADSLDAIVHSAHKYRDSSGEVLVEPIIEYQADLGASKQCEDRVRSIALSLALRKDASLLNVRIDPTSGDVITFERVPRGQFLARHQDALASALGSLHTALEQLQGLVPGQYLMVHEPSHGDNALLYAARDTGSPRRLALAPGAAPPAADDARALRPAPQLTTELLPFHKFRKILPCAFTTHANQIAKEHKKQTPRQKTPPQALRWPKKKGRKKKKTN